MEDPQLQLARLRRRIARIDRKYTGSATKRSPASVRVVSRHDGRFVEELLSGEVVRTAHGAHFETGKLWDPHRVHGSVSISELALLPPDALSALSEAAIADAPPASWAFLDTETTGFRDAHAFLIGVGSIASDPLVSCPICRPLRRIGGEL